MRWTFVIFSVVLVGAAAAYVKLDDPAYFEGHFKHGKALLEELHLKEQTIALSNQIAEKGRRFSRPEELRVSGNALYSKKSAQALLPKDKSFAWWLLNQGSVESLLMHEPMIVRADVERCSMWSLRCFEVKIKEQNANGIALIDGEAWLLNAQGRLFAKVPEKIANRVLIKLSHPKFPVIMGLKQNPDEAPTLIESRGLYIDRALSVIKSDYELTPALIKLRANGELEVKFNGSPVLVVFSSALDNLDQLKVELARLKVVMDEIKGRERAIEQVDLAYASVAVLKIKAEARKDKQNDTLGGKVKAGVAFGSGKTSKRP